MAVCPNCGHQHVSVGLIEKQAPELLDLSPISIPIERWDIVAFEIPKHLASGGNIGVKRVVGLPGERIEIQGGEILVQGKPTTRSETTADMMKILVYDSHFPALESPPRWIATEGWTTADHQSWHFNPNAHHSEIGWLTYRHQACFRQATSSQNSVAVQGQLRLQPKRAPFVEQGSRRCRRSRRGDVTTVSTELSIPSWAKPHRDHTRFRAVDDQDGQRQPL